jgi:threonine aldolase
MAMSEIKQLGAIDLRSDSCTMPTGRMREAMSAAVVGNDMYGEDPTVNALEARAADLLGKQAAVFMPSGVMANQVAISVLAGDGRGVLVGEMSHLHAFEGPWSSRPLVAVSEEPGGDGEAALAERMAEAVAARPELGAVAIENTYMAEAGRVLSEGFCRAVASFGLPVHLDGARLMNAAAATGTTPAQLAAHATTVMLTLSKGFGAPVGSVLAGPADLMQNARLLRLGRGGAMAQAGVFAAAALVALERPVAAFAADNAQAAEIYAAAERRWPGSTGSRHLPVTNIVIFTPPDRYRVLAHLAARGVLGFPWGEKEIRLVTHGDITDDGLSRCVEAIATA